MPLAALFTLTAAVLVAKPPAPLACYARFYAVEVVEESGVWFARLPDAARIPYDDGKTKTLEERDQDPDLEDTFAMPYPQGAIGAVTDEDQDPGRIRVDAIFRATYGATEGAVRAALVKVDFLGEKVRVHRRIVEPLAKVTRRLEALLAKEPKLKPFFTTLGGTFNFRNIAGTERLSMHSYGVAIDLNVARSAYWRWDKPPRWKNKFPQSIVDAFEAEGFIWGGRWFHYDTMHFEYRPELVDRSCYP